MEETEEKLSKCLVDDENKLHERRLRTMQATRAPLVLDPQQLFTELKASLTEENQRKLEQIWTETFKILVDAQNAKIAAETRVQESETKVKASEKQLGETYNSLQEQKHIAETIRDTVDEKAKAADQKLQEEYKDKLSTAEKRAIEAENALDKITSNPKFKDKNKAIGPSLSPDLSWNPMHTEEPENPSYQKPLKNRG